MNRKSTLTLIAALACAASVHAEFFSGNDLLRKMNGNSMDQVNAYGYITGVADAMHKILVCVPTGVTVLQVNDVTRNYLETNPQSRHHTADSQVVAALSAVWPCAKRGSGV